MSKLQLEQFRIQTYTRAQADLAERIRYLLTRGDVVDVIRALDEVEEKGQEMIRHGKRANEMV